MEKKKSVLIIEDELIIAESIKRALIKMNYDVCGMRTSGEESLIACRELIPDIVIMDIKLEGKMSGIQAAEIILEEYGIPAIFLTSYGDDETLEKAVHSQPYGYILKPFEDKELHASIEMAFYKFQMEKKLKENQEFLKQIIDTSPNLIYVYDKNSKYLLANKALGSFLKVDHMEMIGKDLSQIFNTKDLIEDYKKLLHDNENNANEFEITASNGSVKSFKMNKIDIITPDLTPCSLAVAVDITKLKKAENDLKLSYFKLQKLFRETVKGLASAVEIRDPYTAGHQRRVADLAVKISEVLQLDQNTIDGIYLTSLIHDIGKILIPVEILNKPGKLLKAEMDYIKRHSYEGYNILKNIDFPWPVADIILQHHEKIDGSSYPNGLKGDEILLEARIICVADVIEAMASHRPYRASRGINKALGEIEDNSGTLYDKEVVEACLHVFRELKYQFPSVEI